MAEKSEIGVIIVNYNAGDYLRRCLDSVFRSDVKLTVVVVDNGSRDGSFLSLEKLQPAGHELLTIANPDNFGFSRAVNIGLKQLETDFVMLLNPDCVIHPHTLRKMVDTFNQYPQAGIVGSLVFNENGTEQRGCRRREPTLLRSAITSLGLSKRFFGVDMTGEPLPTAPTEVEAVSGSAMMIRRSIILELDGLDEDYFLHCEDLDICHRVRDMGHEVIFDPRVSLFHRQGASGGAGIEKVERLKHDGMLTYYRKHYHGGLGLMLRLMEALVWSRFKLTVWLSKLKKTAVDYQGQMAPEIRFGNATLLLTGAGTDVGAAVMRRLHKSAVPCIAVTRGRPSSAGRGTIRILSLEYFEKAPAEDLPMCDQWLQLAPIWSWQNFTGVFGGRPPRRVVCLSSTSAVTKADSSNDREKAVVEALVEGEKGIARYAINHKSSLAILRPTLIYGGPRNRNINLVKRLVKVLRCFPMVGAGQGERQPVHASDVADACLAALDKSGVNGVYTIAGQEVMTYRQMVERVFQAVGIRPRFIGVPVKFARFLVKVGARLPGLDMLSEQMLDRLERDQSFSNERAARDFGFEPGPFRP